MGHPAHVIGRAISKADQVHRENPWRPSRQISPRSSQTDSHARSLQSLRSSALDWADVTCCGTKSTRERDPWGRALDETVVLVLSTWTYAGTGHASTADTQLALASAAQARECS
jgi:hypothetical protein